MRYDAAKGSRLAQKIVRTNSYHINKLYPHAPHWCGQARSRSFKGASYGYDISKRTFDNFFYEEQERDTHAAGGSNSDLGCGSVLMAMVLIIGAIVIGSMLIIWFLESRG